MDKWYWATSRIAKPGKRKPVPRKQKRRLRNQTLAVRDWLKATHDSTVTVAEVDSDFEREWCDECNKRNCEAHERDMRTYPSE
ncbi:hypothetical protein A2U01_0022965 [Trifolium medium]|uniref:Uncharacterized protein n=1 Tax=Trifolium medium TaxID=97028 RepID=A0A392NTX3_9FABA|nr:hypothetical protein [Trifolium medium]